MLSLIAFASESFTPRPPWFYFRRQTGIVNVPGSSLRSSFKHAESRSPLTATTHPSTNAVSLEVKRRRDESRGLKRESFQGIEIYLGEREREREKFLGTGNKPILGGRVESICL